MEKSFFQKLKTVLYWRCYGIISFLACSFISIYSRFFVKKKDRKYWLMNARRVIESRRGKKREITEFDKILERRKDLLKNHCAKQLRRDFWKCSKKYGYVAEEYFALDLPHQSDIVRNRMVSRMRQFHIVCSLNPSKEQYKADDKAEFVKTFRDFLGRQSLNMNECSQEEFVTLCGGGKIVIKPTNACSGQGVRILNTDALSSVGKENLYEQYKGTYALAEEYIKQEGILHEICPGSVNTVRIATLNDGKEVLIPFAFFRTGRMNGNGIDNLHAGGIVWPVNHLTGLVSGKGFNNDGVEYLVHPDTGIQVTGLKIPHWEKAIETVKKAALLLPELRFLGFDVVISDSGIYLIECNCSSGFWRLYSDSYDLWGYMKDYMDRTLGENRPMRYFEG